MIPKIAPAICKTAVEHHGLMSFILILCHLLLVFLELHVLLCLPLQLLLQMFDDELEVVILVVIAVRLLLCFLRLFAILLNDGLHENRRLLEEGTMPGYLSFFAFLEHMLLKISLLFACGLSNLNVEFNVSGEGRGVPAGPPQCPPGSTDPCPLTPVGGQA